MKIYRLKLESFETKLYVLANGGVVIDAEWGLPHASDYYKIECVKSIDFVGDKVRLYFDCDYMPEYCDYEIEEFEELAPEEANRIKWIFEGYNNG